MYTGQQKSLEQPNFCSSLIDKIWSHKRSPEVRDRGKSPEKKKLKSENNERNESEKGNKKNEIKSITTKLKKVTGTLPSAVRSNDACGTGEKSCEVCSMTREKYKSDLHSAKVVSILVDGVVEKEQAEKMDEEDEEDEPEERDEGSEKISKDNGKGDKLTFNLSVFCEGDVIKHNLKCVLIKLQKTLGDLMVQICFVKSRKLGNEEKYKKFNVSISDLKLLKYEYTNLTDAIIPLFKNPTSAKKKNSPEICVACVKEKLCEYNTRLGEILKSGRNLRVVMRNDATKQGSNKCCSRDYPHVHAEVQGKPIVLKYSMVSN